MNAMNSQRNIARAMKRGNFKKKVNIRLNLHAFLRELLFRVEYALRF